MALHVQTINPMLLPLLLMVRHWLTHYHLEEKQSFGEYVTLDVQPTKSTTLLFCATFSRNDIVFDVYLASSLKAQIRTKCGREGR